MCRQVVTALVALFAFASTAFANAHEPLADASRFFVVKMLSATDLVFAKDSPPTNFVFQVGLGDSIKIDCQGCAAWLDQPSVHGDMAMSLQFPGGSSAIGRHDLGKWVAPYGKVAKIALVFTRDGVGERYLPLSSLTILRKTTTPMAIEAGKAIGLLEVNQLSLPRLDRGGKGRSSIFWAQCRDEDAYQVKAVANDGLATLMLVANVFKIGEEFAKQPLTFAQQVRLPAQGHGNSLFGFEFAEAATANGMKTYHIDIVRIPLHGAGDPSLHDE